MTTELLFNLAVLLFVGFLLQYLAIKTQYAKDEQDAIQKLGLTAAIAINLLMMGWMLYELVTIATVDEPVTRKTVVAIAMYVGMLAVYLVLFMHVFLLRLGLQQSELIRQTLDSTMQYGSGIKELIESQQLHINALEGRVKELEKR